VRALPRSGLTTIGSVSYTPGMLRMVAACLSCLFVPAISACGSNQSPGGVVPAPAAKIDRVPARRPAIVVPSHVRSLQGHVAEVKTHAFMLRTLRRRISLDTDIHTVISGGSLKLGQYAQVAAADRKAAYVALWREAPPRVVVTGTIVALTRLGFTLRTDRAKRVLVVLTSCTRVTDPAAYEVVVSGAGSVGRGIVATDVSAPASPSPSASPSPTPSPSASPSPSPSPSPTQRPTATPSPIGSGLSVPTFSSSFAVGGKTYPYTMVGSNPMTQPASTAINVAIVPLRLTFSDGSVLDATSVAASIPRSPLFTTASYPAGTTQYGDALMRSQFWSYIGNGSANYHVLFANPTVEPTYALSVPSQDGYATNTAGSVEGYMDFDWFVHGSANNGVVTQSQEQQIINQLGIPPSTFTIFATVNAKVLEPFLVNGQYYCCYLGYHYFFAVPSSGGTRTWTTAWASVTTTSVKVLSHEVSEWLNDPLYNNVVPGWISPESGQCGGDEIEVGDPVTEYSSQVNGFEVQDEAFYSWFARQTPSAGINGWYDLQNVLKSPAANC
jgi:hypothetical protein